MPAPTRSPDDSDGEGPAPPPSLQDIYARLAIVRISGDLDAASCGNLKAALTEYFARGQSYLVLNLGDLGFIDSGGLGTIIWALHRIRERKGGLAVVCPDGPVRESFKVTRLDRILDIYPTEDEALRSLTIPLR